MTASSLESIAIADLTSVTGGKGILDNVNIDIKGDINRFVDQVGEGARRVVGCGFAANSRQEFGQCILNGNTQPQK
jgi:hypothetical protein